jgi:hypothetical protein
MTGAGSDVFGKFLLVVVAIWFAPGLYLLPYGLGWFVSALLLAVCLSSILVDGNQIQFIVV